MNLFHKVPTLLLLLFGAVVTAQETDRFAQIGNRQQGTRLHLLSDNPPPALPDVQLPRMKDKRSAFTPLDRMDTREELEEELAKLRQKFLPFMNNHAPEPVKTRHRMYLREFDWRLSTAADQKDFKNVLDGKGTWEKVQVPHYGPPEGRAVTYYRKVFTLDGEILDHKSQFIHFKGVDYRAKVFLNGVPLGSHEGFFAPFEFNITEHLRPGENVLVVRVENDFTTLGSPDGDGQKRIGNKIYAAGGLGWDNPNRGWHHCPPGMGIYQDCFIEGRDPLHINDVFVRPLPGEEAVEVWYEVNNFNEDFKYIKLNIDLYGQNFKETVLKGFEYVPNTTYIPGVGDLAKPQDWQKSKLHMGYGVNFLKVRIPIKSPRLWNNETPYLYQLQTKILNEQGQLTDMQATPFGMRSFTQDTLTVPKGQMYLNGEKIRLRGANTMGFLQLDVKNKDWDRLRDDLLLAKACNMNFIRLTQRPVQPEIYEYADQLGMMLQTDLPLFGSLRPNLFSEAVKQAGEMERLVRNHPSNIMVTYINERFPNAEGHPQRSMATAEDYYRFFKAADQAVHHWNPDRVIKAGDGDYDPPSPGLPDNHMYNVWYNGHALGLGELHQGYWQKTKPDWLYGCGEFGAEAFDNYPVVKKYWPKEWLPTDESKPWNPDKVVMAQTQRFHHMWYPTPVTLKDWISASQEHQAWATRTVAEAFRRDNRMVSFAIHLFIDAWPAGWMKAIMDVDRNPKKAFFAYRDALAPLMVSFRTDRYHFYEGETMPVELWLSNDLNEVPAGHVLKWQWEKEGKVIKSAHMAPKLDANASRFQGYVNLEAPKVSKRSQYQLRAALFDADENGVSESVIDIDLFPKNSLPSDKTVYAPSTLGPAQTLCSQLGIETAKNPESPDVILIDEMAQYLAEKNRFDSLVSQGKRLIFLELPAGTHSIGDRTVTIENTVMGEYYFVNPESGHPLVKGFKDFDFRLWYDGAEKMIKPLLASMIKMDLDLIPILKTGKTTWVDIKGEYAAAAEFKTGKGSYIINQVRLNDQIEYNPTAALYAHKLLNQ